MLAPQLCFVSHTNALISLQPVTQVGAIFYDPVSSCLCWHFEYIRLQYERVQLASTLMNSSSSKIQSCSLMRFHLADNLSKATPWMIITRITFAESGTSYLPVEYAGYSIASGVAEISSKDTRKSHWRVKEPTHTIISYIALPNPLPCRMDSALFHTLGIG